MKLDKLLPSLDRDSISIIAGYLYNFSGVKTHQLTLEEEITDIILLKDRIVTTNPHKLEVIGLDNKLLSCCEACYLGSHLVPLGDETYCLVFGDENGYMIAINTLDHKISNLYYHQRKLLLVGDDIIMLKTSDNKTFRLPSKIKLSCKVDDSLILYTEDNTVRYYKIEDYIVNHFDIQLEFPITMLLANKNYIFLVRDNNIIRVYNMHDRSNYEIRASNIKQVFVLDDNSIIINTGETLLVYNPATNRIFRIFIEGNIERVIDANTLLFSNEKELIILDIYQAEKIFRLSLDNIDCYTMCGNKLLIAKDKQVEIYS